MFKDRDLAILGAGGLLTVLCLLLPFESFAPKILVGSVVLVISMTLALLRVGPDRISLEQWLWRRIRFATMARKASYVRAEAPPAPPKPVVQKPEKTKAASGLGWFKKTDKAPAPQPVQAEPSMAAAPVAFAWEDVGLYPIVTLLLAVVGAYAFYWMVFAGGGEEMGLLINALLGGG